MREPPPHVSEDDVLDQVWAHWLPGVERLTHLPVGFGAWHWQAWAAGRPVLFVTLDQLDTRHTARSLEDAYRAAAAFAARDLEFVHANRPTVLGRCTVPLGSDQLSATPWLEGHTGDGTIPDAESAKVTADMLRRLHQQVAPPSIPRWRPLVHPAFASRLADRTSHAWTLGPYGERARTALRERLPEITKWTSDYLALAAETEPARWVPTHGEPHTRNQVVTAEGTRLVDWESVKLAPPERDLRYLVEQGWSELCDADPRMVEMFDLEWRLDEISQYADWFEGPHSGTESDGVAIEGLLHELSR